jgi:hypothetical protein
MAEKDPIARIEVDPVSRTTGAGLLDRYKGSNRRTADVDPGFYPGLGVIWRMTDAPPNESAPITSPRKLVGAPPSQGRDHRRDSEKTENHTMRHLSCFWTLRKSVGSNAARSRTAKSRI